MCCGQKRAQLTTSMAKPSPRTAGTPVPQPRPQTHNQTWNQTRNQLGNQAPNKMPIPPASFRPASGAAPRHATPQHLPFSETTTPTDSADPRVLVRYLEVSPVLLRGVITGQVYRFSAAQPLQPVDPRDASAILQSRFFRRG